MGSAGMRTHRVIGGETLDTIAFKELGSASQWRHIAELNNLDDPLSIVPGQHLMIAPLR
jgi:nucleoid-associated protein YgaU